MMYHSETEKHRDKFLKYCFQLPGLDIGSGGDPILVEAISVDLPTPYCPLLGPALKPNIPGDGTKLIWFRDDSMAWVYSSHLIEDFTAEQQEVILKEWTRVLKPGGFLLILAPDHERWQEVLRQNRARANLAHRHEPSVGEFTKIANRLGNLIVLEDRFCDDSDYSLMFCAIKRKI